jgi:hypothetical protein
VNRRALRRLGLAALAIVALGVAAATVDSVVVPEAGGGPGVGSGGSGTFGAGDEGDVGVDDGPAGQFAPLPVCYPILNDPRVIGAVLLAFLVVGYLAYRDTESLLPPLALWIAFGIPVGTIYVILTSCNPPRPLGSGLGSATENASLLPAGSGAGSLGSQAGRTVSTPSALLGVLLVVALVGAVLMLFVSTADEEERPAEPEPTEPPQPDVGAVGRAAGAAADRIEADADVDNEVYRAWSEMTRHLDVSNPDVATPAEFATAAVEAGMAPDDVRELTGLFETVRYGGESATPEREGRAIDALRRIEATYAGSEAHGLGDGEPYGLGDGEAHGLGDGEAHGLGDGEPYGLGDGGAGGTEAGDASPSDSSRRGGDPR